MESAGLVDPLSTTVVNPTVKIGGADAPVLFSGLVPGYAGIVRAECQRLQLDPARLECAAHNFTVNDFTYSQNVRVVQK